MPTKNIVSKTALSTESMACTSTDCKTIKNQQNYNAWLVKNKKNMRILKLMTRTNTAFVQAIRYQKTNNSTDRKV